MNNTRSPTIPEIISEIEADKIRRLIHPSHVLLSEIRKITGKSKNDIKAELDELEAKGIIKTGRTINSIWITKI